jgi:hypothetical protein
VTDTGFRPAGIETSKLAMPYATVSNGELEPIFHYGCLDYPYGAIRDERDPPGAMARRLHEPRGLRRGPGARRVHGPRDQRHQIPDLVGWRRGRIWYGQRRWGFFTMEHTGGDYGKSTRMFFRPDRQVGMISLTNACLGGGRWAAFSDIERRLFQEFS